VSIDGVEETGQNQLDLADSNPELVDIDENAVSDSDEQLPSDDSPDPDAISVETLIESLEQVTAERDDLKDSIQRLQAEFENFRRRSAKELEQRVAVGVSGIAEALLPILDACDAADAQGLEDVAPIHSALVMALKNFGLVRIEALGSSFNPNEHEAMSLETGDGDEQIVVEEFRPGYKWGASVLRPAMVKVREQ